VTLPGSESEIHVLFCFQTFSRGHKYLPIGLSHPISVYNVWNLLVNPEIKSGRLALELTFLERYYKTHLLFQGKTYLGSRSLQTKGSEGVLGVSHDFTQI